MGLKSSASSTVKKRQLCENLSMSKAKYYVHSTILLYSMCSTHSTYIFRVVNALRNI